MTSAEVMKRNPMDLLYRTVVRSALMDRLAKHKPPPRYQRFNRKEMR